MTIFNQANYIQLNNSHVENNFASVITGTGREYVSSFKISGDIKNPLMLEFSPPPADGLQYEVDRQNQLRSYAQTINHYTLGLYVKKNGVIFPRKRIPLYKYFPDHQVNLFPLLWDAQQGVLGAGEELLFKFEANSILPDDEDSIICVLHYSILYSTTAITWFTLNLPANTEISQRLPDNVYEITLKQLNLPTSPLYFSFLPDEVSSLGNRDEIQPQFEKTEEILGVQKRTLYMMCSQPTTVLLKCLSL